MITVSSLKCSSVVLSTIPSIILHQPGNKCNDYTVTMHGHHTTLDSPRDKTCFTTNICQIVAVVQCSKFQIFIGEIILLLDKSC